MLECLALHLDMTTPHKTHCSLLALVAVLTLSTVGPATAQTFTNLHSFTSLSDGANPHDALTASGGVLYGTTSSGGGAGNGSIFAINTDGTGFTNLHSLAYIEGINPFSGLALASNTIYGTASQGGASGNGTVFAVNTDGTGFALLHVFSGGGDGANPFAGLVVSGGTLYGTVSGGGAQGNGAVFSLNTDGTGFKNLHSFTGGADGSSPYGGLVISGGALYGTTAQGGGGGNGVVFSINTDGTGFKNLHSFTGADGAGPNAGMYLTGSTLYGATSSGGASGNGAVFSINTDGTGYANLYSFSGGAGGASPNGVIFSGGALYGTTSVGGAGGNGLVFSIGTNGAGFTNLYSFTANPPPGTNTDGAVPRAGLVSTGGSLYGTTFQAGASNKGTLFEVVLNGAVSPPPAPIPLLIQMVGASVVLSWANPVFTLQSASDITGVFTNLPGATTGYTNPITGARQFFRLISN